MFLETIAPTYYNDLAVVILMPLIFIFLMCMVDLRRTNLLFKSIFSNQYFYEYSNDSLGRFSAHRILKFVFISFTLSLLIMFLWVDVLTIYQQFLTSFLPILCWSLFYFFIKYLLLELLFLSTRKQVFYKQMLMLEMSYLMSCCLPIYMLLCCFFLHLENHEAQVNFMLISSLMCYVFRFFKLLINNKNLLSNKIVHIILYLCILEILPIISLYIAII